MNKIRDLLFLGLAFGLSGCVSTVYKKAVCNPTNLVDVPSLSGDLYIVYFDQNGVHPAQQKYININAYSKGKFIISELNSPDVKPQFGSFCQIGQKLIIELSSKIYPQSQPPQIVYQAGFIELTTQPDQPTDNKQVAQVMGAWTDPQKLALQNISYTSDVSAMAPYLIVDNSKMQDPSALVSLFEKTEGGYSILKHEF